MAFWAGENLTGIGRRAVKGRNMSLAEKIDLMASSIRKKVDIVPQVAVILGSGLGALADEVENPVYVPYSDVQHLPVSTVKGHAGRFVFGKIADVPVVMMQGRFHYYEGYELSDITLPVRLMKAVGASELIVTNAAGGLQDGLSVGDLMVIEDHMNLLFDNPLRGPNDDSLGPRFPDMHAAYSPVNRERIREIADKQGLELKKGVYAFVPGPSYETPAELRFFKKVGVDAVGMSTVPEVIVARHCGYNGILGISFITNVINLDEPVEVNHEEVIEATRVGGQRFVSLVTGYIRGMVK